VKKYEYTEVRTFMTSNRKRMIVPIISLIVLIACVSCAVVSKVNENAQTAPITSKWTFDHATKDGKNIPRYILDKDEDLPHFTSDGETFTFNIVSGTNYSGTLEQNDDGSYTLRNEYNSDQTIRAVVKGNSLTIYTPGESTLVFVVI